MGKNNKNQQTKKDAEKAKATAPIPAVKKEEKPKTGLTEQKPVPPVTKEEVKKPAEDATGAVETAAVEEIQQEAPKGSSLVAPKVDSLVAMMQPQDLMDANHAAIFMDTMERRLSKMKPNEPLTIKMESMLDYNMMWFAIKLSVQSFAQKREMNMITPNDEAIVQEAIDMAASMGVALTAHPTKDGQMALTFSEGDINPETKAAAVEEVAAQATTVATTKKSRDLTPEQMDPMNWKTDDDAKKALMQDIRATKESPSNKFLRLLNKVKTYRENMETDPVKKSMWQTASLGMLTKELITLIGNKGIIVLNGLMTGTTGSMRLGQTMIFAHSTMKKNMPVLKDTEIVDLIKTFIEITHKDPNQPIDQDLAVVNGILAPTRDTFVRIALMKPNESENIEWFKKIFNPFYQMYKDEIGSKVIQTEKGVEDNPDFPLKVANKMIEIRNLYVDKDAAFPLFTKADFDAVIGS